MEEKLKYFLDKLRKLPDCRNDDFYRLADYIELKCLVNPDGSYSQAEFIDDARQRNEDLGEGDFEEREQVRESNTPKARRNDQWETITQDTFRVIEARKQMFGDKYPFELSDSKKSIQLLDIDTSTNYDSYIFLLLCSNLKYTNKFKSDLTSSFEVISEEVLKLFIPNAESKLFGSSNTESSELEWKSAKLWDKLVWMNEFIKGRLQVVENEISKYDKGDRGVDLIAKVVFNDNTSHFPIYFGQCACSPTQWEKKQSDMHRTAWTELISLRTEPNYFMFIPQSFRDSTGLWHDRTKIRSTVLVDRSRILGLLPDDRVNRTSSYPIIERIKKVKEAVI